LSIYIAPLHIKTHFILSFHLEVCKTIPASQNPNAGRRVAGCAFTWSIVILVQHLQNYKYSYFLL